MNETSKSLLSKPKFLVCIDEKDHTRVALQFACIKAKKTGANLALIYVIDPVDFNTFFSVADSWRKEHWDKAEKLVLQLCEEVHKHSGIIPSIVFREGVITQEIVEVADEDNDINMLILGAAPDGSTNKNRILPTITASIGDKLHIPVLIVPGNLTDQQIEELT